MEGEHRELEIDEDMRFQRLQWALERVGWGAIAAILVASLLGFVGGRGLIDERVERATDSLGGEVRFPRFIRWRAPVQIDVRAGRRGESGEWSVWFGHDLLEDFEVRWIVPQPARAEFAGAGVRFVFLGSGAPEPVVRFGAVARRVGSVGGRLGASPESAVRLKLFAFP